MLKMAAKYHNIWFFFLIAALNLSGCSIPYVNGYGEKGQSKKDFEHYVESVFKFQNQLTSQVMMISASGEDLEDYDELLQAEQQMREACEPLNEYAVKEIDGSRIGFFLRRRVERSAYACEKSAFKVENLLK